MYNCNIILTLTLSLAAAMIKECVPNSEVIFNMVPKVHAMSEIYCQLIPNDDPNQLNYEIMPRMGSFEISIDGIVSILFLLFIKNLSRTFVVTPFLETF